MTVRELILELECLMGDLEVEIAQYPGCGYCEQHLPNAPIDTVTYDDAGGRVTLG